MHTQGNASHIRDLLLEVGACIDAVLQSMYRLTHDLGRTCLQARVQQARYRPMCYN